MAYRYTNTDKWSDAWFCELDKEQKLLFIYLCDNCDCGGFIEINKKKWAFECDMKTSTLEGALKGLESRLKYSLSGDCIYIINFLKHQKNLPLNDTNRQHIGIFKRFDMYRSKFGFGDTCEFIDSQMEIELITETKKSEKNEKVIALTWRNDYDIYLSELREVYRELRADAEWISEREKFNKNIDVLLTLEKACVEFWATKQGWAHKKKGRALENDWRATLTKAISQRTNMVWKGNSSTSKNSAAGKILEPESVGEKNKLLNKFKDATNKRADKTVG